MNKDTFIKKIVKELEENNVAIFAGAGLSIPAGHVDWKKLLKPFAEELEIDIDKETDLVSLAQYYCNNQGSNRHDISQAIMNEFDQIKQPTENHQILAKLPISTFWTTNYDSLIEDSLKIEGKIVDVKYTIEQLALTKPKRNTIVYKMHGDKSHAHKAIIIKDDYEKYHINCAPFITALSGDLISKTFIFIGFSFTDPNLDYILSRIRATYNENQRTHYSFIKKVHKKDFSDQEDYDYFQKKQVLFINDLKRYNIQTVEVNEYNEITSILKSIEKCFSNKNIFISGSAADYDGFENPLSFISNLSKSLIKKKFNIVTGFGLGVGSQVICGALEEIYIEQRNIDNDRILMRPFPQPNENEDFKELWHKYRIDMISRVGIAIFLFGNKLKEDEIVDADGVYSEFGIAKQLKVNIIPVGSTGWISSKIWNEVNNNFDDFYPKASQTLKGLFAKLNTEQGDSLIETIIEFISEINKRG